MANVTFKSRLSLDACEARLSPNTFLLDLADPLGLAAGRRPGADWTARVWVRSPDAAGVERTAPPASNALVAKPGGDAWDDPGDFTQFSDDHAYASYRYRHTYMGDGEEPIRDFLDEPPFRDREGVLADPPDQRHPGRGGRGGRVQLDPVCAEVRHALPE
jgi:hypothetical protein